MKLKESLTKENFWNEMQEKFPKAMKVFCDWIDEYKKEVKWNKLFSYAEHDTDFPKPSPYPAFIKFHDIPYAMQLGIWIEFCKQQEFYIQSQVGNFILEDSIREYLNWKKFQNIE